MRLLKVSEGEILLRHLASWQKCPRCHMELNAASRRLLVPQEEHVHDELHLVHSVVTQELKVVYFGLLPFQV